MENAWPERLSVSTRGVLSQFFAGVALVAIIPMLAVVYLETLGRDANGTAGYYLPLVVSLCVLAGAFGGYLLLRRHPWHIVRLRNRLEGVIERELAKPLPTARAGDDMEAVEKCMTTVLQELRQHIRSAEDEKVRLEEKLFQVQKMDCMRVMATGVAHDLNNLLAAILGNISMILRDSPKDSASKENALQVESTALQAVELTNQVMAYSGRGNWNRQPVDLITVIGEMRNLLDVTVPKTVLIDYRLADGVPAVSGDAASLRQVIVNLVTNAAESYPSRRGTVVVSVDVTTCDRSQFNETYLSESLPEGRYLRIEVSDQGQGMTSEVQRRIFDPFFSTKLRGRGLGLSVVMGVVRGHGGAVKVQSAPQKGTTMTVFLPALPVRAS